MTTTDGKPNRQVLRTQRLMLDAARELLADHGTDGVTHLKIAQKAGVARATVYRHWPDRAAILVDLLRTSADIDLSPPAADLPIDERVAAVLRSFTGALNGDGGRTLAAMIGLAEWDDDVFAALERMTDFGPAFLRATIAAGVDDGSLIPGSDAALLTDMLIGPLYFRRLIYHDKITDVYVERLVACTLGPLLAR